MTHPGPGAPPPRPPRWHRHTDLHCNVCGKLVWERITCVLSPPKLCRIESDVVCAECRAEDEGFIDTAGLEYEGG